MDATNITASSVIFRWDAVPCARRGGALLRYDVMIRLVEDNVITGVASTSSGSPFMIQDLKPSTTYAVSIRYVNSVGTGSYSTEYQVRTLSTCEYITMQTVNNYIVRSYRDVIVVTNIATRRTSKA